MSTTPKRGAAETSTVACARNLVRHAFGLLPLGFYVFTVSPTPGWADAALIARNVDAVDLQIWVNNHNLFTLVAAGWVGLLPDSVQLAYALNLLCAVLGATTVYLLFLIGLRLGASLVASALGAIALMLSHSLWWHSTMVEVYTLSALLLALTVLFVLRYEQGDGLRNLCGAAFCFGLGCSNHAQMGLLLFAFVAIMVWPEQRRVLLKGRTLGLLAFSFSLGFQVYLWVFASELVERMAGMTDPMESLGAVLGSMLDDTTGGRFRQYMFPSGLSFGERTFWWLFFLSLFVYNFPSLAIILGPLGAGAWLRSGRYPVTLSFVGVAFVTQLIWASNYFVWDMYAFSLPAYTLFAIFVIIGIDWIFRRAHALRMLVYALSPTLLISPLLYAKTPGWLAADHRAAGLLRTLPQYDQATAFWDPLPYFFDPNKRGFDSVQRYSEAAMRQLDASACYWGDEAKLLYPLKYYYQESLGRRTDVNYNLIFAILQREPAFRSHAAKMVNELRIGCPVYVSSVGYPERDVLNYVYTLLDRKLAPASVARLSTTELLETFPRYRFEPVDLDESDGVKIYKLVPRPSSLDSGVNP